MSPIEAKRAEVKGARTAFVMSTYEGRSFVWDVLASTGLYRQSYVPDSNGTAFNEGQRSVGLRMYADLETHCPEQYLLMQREAAQRAQVERREIEDERARRASTEQ